MRTSLGTIREFRTAQFRVIVDAIEDDSPDISFDETTETRDKLESGEWVIFCARARVIHHELGELSSDYLGNCIYTSVDAFMDHKACAAETRKLRTNGSNAVCGSYFADMVKTVCHDARQRLRALKEITQSAYVRPNSINA